MSRMTVEEAMAEDIAEIKTEVKAIGAAVREFMDMLRAEFEREAERETLPPMEAGDQPS